MSHTTNDASNHETTQKRHKVNPATCSREELIQQLATDPGAGLSPKEAARRRDRALSRPLYSTGRAKPSASYAGVLREVSLWLFVAVSVFALFFDRVALGLVCLVLTFGHVLLCAALGRRDDRVNAAMQATDAPLARVLRGRKVRRVAADALVPGDILLLHPGDMIPADARLLRSTALVISERPFTAGDAGERPTLPDRLEKDAEVLPSSGSIRRHSPVNMVFAGGVVESGFAVAVVVAVGSDTHLAGLIGTVTPAHPTRMPAVLRRAARPLSVINLCLLALVIPLTVIGILTLRDRYELLDIVLSALALATLTLTEHLLVKGRGIAAAHRRDAATLRDVINTADIKSAADLEKLTTLTDLFLVGTAALHDGKPHPVSLRIGTTTYRCDHPDADDAARSLTELLCLYMDAPTDAAVSDGSAPSPTLAAVLSELVPELVEWSDMDREALAVKAGERKCADGWVSAILPTVEGNRRVGVSLTTDFRDLYACDECFTAGSLRTAGREASPDTRSTPADERLEELHRAYLSAAREGLSAFFVMTEISGRRTVHAMVTYAPAVCPKTAGNIRAMEAAGIRVSAYLRDASPENDRVLAACGLTDRVAADDLAATPAEELSHRASVADRLMGGCRAFVGCSDAYMREAIRDLRAAGRTVAVMSVDARDLALLDEADLAITCSPSLFDTAEAGELSVFEAEEATAQNPHAGPDGRSDGDLATDLCRRRAAILVRRAAPTGGGVCGLRTALLTADRFKTALDRFYIYLLLAQLLRLISTVVPLCLGLAPAAATTLLLSGLLGDVLAYLAIMALSAHITPAPRRTLGEGLGNPWRTHRATILVTVGAALLPWMVAGIAHLVDVDFGADLTHYGLLCLLALQIPLFCTDRLPRRDRKVFFAVLAMVLLYVGALAGALGAGLSLVWAMVIPAALGLVYGVVMEILRKRA